MHLLSVISSIIVLVTVSLSNGQKITTIQLDGVQYFISRMNPYTAELNFFLAYQYCRSLGLQLASFEAKEKADSITEFLKNAGYDKYDFWISGNTLGTDMMLWMSTGTSFNATFNYMRKRSNEIPANSSGYDIPNGSTSPQRTARESGSNGLHNSCIAMKAPRFDWDTDDCLVNKDFICEQTRCYYYNYGPIPVSSSQGKTSATSVPQISSTTEQAKFVPMGINELIHKLKSSTFVPAHPDDVNINTAVPVRDEDAEVEMATNGPYDNFHSNIEMQDDPSAVASHNRYDDNDASTLQPDMATMFAGPHSSS
ncbi:hypothetical protein PPYR_05560 [Photinus pyralis]|uniref:C-type lectin domain-containing protein n=3 Tax=Photinus pyralis TaxID=7054 RepID=A0A5N4AV55_PHOPY|nr:uncharacterized protein LOC116165720 [Photinus pyralis]KAB0801206.1 hypothetical protein PPYR_05560 [Photinus pyralis]